MRIPPSRGRGPWAIASFIGIPLFFCALMGSTLAQEKPHVVQWKGCKGICTTWHEPSSATEARIWLWAIVPPVVLSIIGFICTRLPLGWYIACAAGIVEALACAHRVSTWAAHHVARFPWGVDLIPGTNSASNQYDPGEWEKIARETALSLEHWTIGLALAAMLVMAALHVRRRFFSRAPFALGDDDGVLEGVHAPDATGASVPVE
jgi:hypothetical protein